MRLISGMMMMLQMTAPGARTVEIVVDRAYTPAVIEATAGEPLVLRFVQRSYSPCLREVVFPSLGIRRTLPPGETVEIELPALPAGDLEFHCGMKMVRGLVRVTAR